MLKTNIFDYAMQMEQDGEQYYRRLVQQTDNKGLKTILTMLADDEVTHYQIIQDMKAKEPRLSETSILSDAKNIFIQMKESKEKVDLDVEQAEFYRKAQTIEQKSIDFYLENANKVDQEYQKQIFLKLAAEEKKHYFVLENIIEFISRPGAWLENAEFNHLEEY